MSRKLCSRRRSCQGNGFRFTTVVSLTIVGSRIAPTRPEPHCEWQRVSSKWKRRSGLMVLSDTYIWEKLWLMVGLQVSPVCDDLGSFLTIYESYPYVWYFHTFIWFFVASLFCSTRHSLPLPAGDKTWSANLSVCVVRPGGLAALSRWLAPCES